MGKHLFSYIRLIQPKKLKRDRVDSIPFAYPDSIGGCFLTGTDYIFIRIYRLDATLFFFGSFQKQDDSSMGLLTACLTIAHRWLRIDPNLHKPFFLKPVDNFLLDPLTGHSLLQWRFLVDQKPVLLLVLP
jgi:hypothetical protein